MTSKNSDGGVLPCGGEPGELYLTHVAPKDGKCRSTAQAMFDAIKNTLPYNTLAIQVDIQKSGNFLT